VRLVLWPLAALASVLLYQGANAAVYYFVGELVWGWAYAEGEVCFFFFFPFFSFSVAFWSLFKVWRLIWCGVVGCV